MDRFLHPDARRPRSGRLPRDGPGPAPGYRAPWLPAGACEALAALAGLCRAAPVDVGSGGTGRCHTAGRHHRLGQSHRTRAGGRECCRAPFGRYRDSRFSEGVTMSAHGPGSIMVTVLDTPIGPLSLLAHDGALVGGGFTADPAELHVRTHSSLRALELAPARQDDLSWLVKPVCGYFEGDAGAFDGLTVHQPGTPSRQRLWAAMRAVAPGTTVSYAVLAAQAGNPAQLPRTARPAGPPRRATRRRRRLRGQPDRPRRPVPPCAAHRRQPGRLLLRAGPQEVAAAS